MKRVLFAGESWSSTTIHTKGFDSFITSTYEEGGKRLETALTNGGFEVVYMPNHKAGADFPWTLEELSGFDAVILSDIGSNTLLLSPEVFAKSAKTPNRCDLLREYVLKGGSLCMIGGYLTFTGIDAKGRWGQTAVADVLPVSLVDIDDRVEIPQGEAPVILSAEHPVFAGIPAAWPEVLGYNKTIAKEGCDLLATIGANPFIAVGEFGKGRSAVFTSDCSPHWAPPDFCDWQYYGIFWKNLVNWLTNH